jgi:hypothetical protein
LPRSRRTLGVDLHLAEEVKAIAHSRGMSLANYLRKLFEEVIEAERAGYFAPSLLAEKRAETVLSKLGFTYLPLELLDGPRTPEYTAEVGSRVGSALKELGLSCTEFIERLATDINIAVVRGDSLVLVPSSGARELLRRFLAGLAEGCEIPTSTSGNLIVVRLLK